MIRYDKKTLNQVRKIVTNYNRRVERIAKNDIYGNAYIPKKENLKDIISLTSKIDLNRKLRDLQAYNKKSAEQIVSRKGKSLSLYEYNLNKKYKDILRRDLNKKIKFYETNYAQTRGKKEKFTLAKSGSRDYLNLIAKKERLLKRDIFDLDYETLQANVKTKDLSIWQNNYIDILTDIAQTFGISNYKNIIDNIKKLSPKQFNEFSKVERTIQQIIYYYKAMADVGINYAAENYQEDIQNLFDVLNNDIEEIIKDYR